jgi:3-mercaptopyruvate sulfurtransferase SseA
VIPRRVGAATVERLAPSTLLALLGDRLLRLLDLRSIADDPNTLPFPKVIPGAIRLGSLRPVALLSMIELAAAMATHGIGDDHLVVLYDSDGHGEAQRVAELLADYGHSLTALLQGGWQRWCNEGHRVTRGFSIYPPTTFTVRRRDLP